MNNNNNGYPYYRNAQPEDLRTVYVGELQRPTRHLISRLRKRRFLIVDFSGRLILDIDLFRFRTELSQHPARLMLAMAAPNVALAGWFTEAELVKQLKFLRRASRAKPDTALERQAMFPATIAAAQIKHRGTLPPGYMWLPDFRAWSLSVA